MPDLLPMKSMKTLLVNKKIVEEEDNEAAFDWDH
jgi:hypothetical protein